MLRFLFILFTFSFVAPDEELQTGIDYFNARSENAKGLQANDINVNKAIQVFENQLKHNKNVLIAGGYYMQCLNFKGRFVYTTESERKAVYTKAAGIGTDLVKKYPKDGKIRFELISSIALLAEINGVMKSVESGVMTKLLFHTRMLIETDSMYNDGGGWKTEAALNYKTPYIPMVITWPDKKKAVKIMKNALRHFPTNVGCNFYYAEALQADGQKPLAKIYFLLANKYPCRKHFPMEDEFFKMKARKYLEKL
ncbi:MAG TPA: hypothetical protein VGC65_08160 [Bacteroidia bacterium]|jgi:hypothetical protein